MGGKTETDISNAELINGLQHMADDHPCCKDTISMTIDQIEKLERENAALREQLEQAAIDEGKLRRENTRLLEAILNAPKAVCEELDRRVVRKEAQP